MKSHSKVRAVSLLSLSIAVALFGAIPASNAAAKATTTPKAAAKATAKPTPKPSVKAKANPKITKLPTAGADGNRGGGRFANLTTAQRACLVKNGVTIPAPRAGSPTARPTPNPSRSPGAFSSTRNTFNNPKTTAAFKNCGIALPTGGLGGGAFNSAKFQAFTKCMTAAGFQPTGGFGRYDQSDPSTVAALIKCQKSTGFTLPKPGQFGNN